MFFQSNLRDAFIRLVFLSSVLAVHVPCALAIDSCVAYRLKPRLDRLPAASEITLKEAPKWLELSLQCAGTSDHRNDRDKSDLALYDIHIREDGFQWDSFSLNFVDFVGDLIRAKASKNPLKWVGGVGWMILVNGKKPTGKLEGLNHIWWPWADDAQLFVEAINILAAHAIQNPAKEQFLFEDFREKARSWRDLPTKPELPEEARRHRVLAENALLEKDLDRALAEYEAGLESYPLWPQGQFDAALLCEQKKLYSKAVGYMKRYLELAPDAPDARAARDKIIIWQDKLNR